MKKYITYVWFFLAGMVLRGSLDTPCETEIQIKPIPIITQGEVE